MTDDERSFAQQMLEELEWQHPRMFKLIRGGVAGKEYERQLIEDYDNDLFSKSELKGTASQGTVSRVASA
jgi:hypothetical protein